ncbi:hypothetical protein D8Y60_002334 [Escherichia coli]|nr:hypothetical protein [Escherichia coli]
MNERLKTHSKTQKKSADLVSNKLRIGVFQRYQMKCKSVSKKSPRYIVLAHADNVEAAGFVSHLKLPHYVDFQAELELLKRLQQEKNHG